MSVGDRLPMPTPRSKGPGPASPFPGVGLRSGLLKPATLASFVLAFGLLAVALTWVDFDLGRIAAAVVNADGRLLLLATLAHYLTFPARGWRWRAMLRSAGTSARLSTPYLSSLVLAGWFVNCLTPLKLGDLYRVYYLQRRKGVPIALATGTIAVEKVVDLVCALLLVGVSGLLVSSGRIPDALLPYLQVGAVAVMAAALSLLVLWCYGDQLGARLPPYLADSFHRFRSGAIGGLMPVGWLLVTTPLCWLPEVIRFWLITEAIGLRIGSTAIEQLAAAAFVTLGAAALAAAAPTPGGLGAVELATVGALALVGVFGEMAVAAALLDQLIGYWSTIVGGVVAYLVWQLPALVRHCTRLAARWETGTEP
jgi:hypothetical protein